MRRATFAVLAFAAALISVLFTANVAGAQAPAATISVTGTATQWSPESVTVATGDTVRWTFDGSTLPHNVKGTSPNWNPPLDSPTGTGQAPVDYTFTVPGLYTFVCEVHPGMDGSVTVEDDEGLDNVLVFSKTQTEPTPTFRHTSIDEGIAAIQAIGAANDFNVVATEDSTQFTDANLAQFDAVVFLSTTGDILNDEQQAAFERYIQSGGGFVGIHAAADTEYGWDWYGDMVGGYFRNHPAGTPTATVNRADPDEPSTQPVPATWSRTDEWYNYQRPVDPSPGGGGADYDLRVSDVKVLLTVDEASYNEDDGSNAADYHAIAWCSNFDGGRVWYTGMGHTEASFADTDFREHLLGGIQTAAGSVAADCGEERMPQPQPEDFEKVTLEDDTQNPMELDVAPDGRVFYIERDGRLMIIKPDTGQTVEAGRVAVDLAQENGMIGLQLAPDFATSQWVYLAYSEPDNATRQDTQVVARYKMVGDTLNTASRQEVISWQAQRDTCCHSSGSLYFGPDGSLYISTGDNTNPFRSDGFAPIDERPGAWPATDPQYPNIPFAYFDAQRTSANTNNLNGKILRIRPNPDTPGYTVPAGNLFPAGTANAHPEIFAMGFRNPFRFTVDPETGWVLMGDYGPDAGSTVDGRGPQGSVEFNTVTQPGNYGWPYCVRDNTPYNDYNFATGQAGAPFNCAAPQNTSPNNTGATSLPAAIGADAWMGYTEQDPRFVPDLGGGGAPTGGPRYHYDPDGPPSKFPEYYDGLWFNGEWNHGWIKTFALDGQGSVTDVDPFPYLGPAGCTFDGGEPTSCYKRPMDMDFGPDGSLYLIEWGSGFGGNNANSGIYRIDYVATGRRPVAHATATPDNGPAPLTVQFSSAGSEDPDGTAITYAWDFDGNGTTDSTEANPTHTYTNTGNYSALLRVTDAAGQTGTDTVRITVGNTAPVVTIEIPEEGQFAAFGETVPYRISVTDAEDGSTGGGGIACADVSLNVSLGHDKHAHTLTTKQGCEGTFSPAGAADHGGNVNVFPVIEAVYTDEGGTGGAGALTSRDIHVLQPKRKEAEYFASTGRIGSATGGVQTETTTDAGGGQNIGFIEHGDWVSYEPVNFKDITSLRFRVASGGAGGTIQVRLDAPDGPLVAETAMIPNTGGWQTWTTVDLALPQPPPAGAHELFLVFSNPAAQPTDGLLNVNYFEARGKGAAVSAPPDVTATAEPTGGNAPLQVKFTGTATDPDAAAGEQLTYLWDFGVAGTTDDRSTELSPTYTYERPGTYLARFTATDPHGASSTASVQVQVTSAGQCPQDNVRSDEFNGDSLDTNRWQIIRPDSTRPPTVSGGNLNFPIDNGSIYGTGTSARNIIVQPLPDGQVEVTAKITTEPLTQNFQQAGLRVYQDDNNWASVHMIYAGTGRDFEFIYENNGNPRNEAADKLNGIPADAPLTYWVRLISDGSTLRAEYSYDGVDFRPVGRVADISGWAAPQIGPVALSDAATTYPVARFDWIRFNPDSSGGGGGGGGSSETELFADQFEGTDLGAGWDVVRRNQSLRVSGGALRIPAATGDLYQGNNTAANLVLRDLPASGSWRATAKVNFEGLTQYQQAGIIVRGTDDDYVKLGRIAHTTAGDEKFEFIHEAAATPDNTAADSTANIAADFPDDYWVQLRYDGTSLTGWYSADGSTWTQAGRAWPLPANARVGVFAFGNTATSAPPEAAFDSFRITRPATTGGPSFDDEFDGSSLDKNRWNAIVRDTPSEYRVAGGELTITTSPGDIYTQDTPTPPNNFILQDASHAGADWTIETKISRATISNGYAQGGLMAYANGDNYVKFDAISDAPNSEVINRIELRSEVGGTIQNPQQNVDVPAANGAGPVYLRLTKSGTSYSGEYSFDGETWTAFPGGPVPNPMQAPDFGLFAFGPQASGVGETVTFDYFWLDGQDESPCECVPTGGDSFDSGTLDTGKWNAIVRPQNDLITFNDGWLEIKTVNGDIYTTGNPAPTRNFILQEPTEANQDWVIETHIDAATLSQGYEQAGLMARVDDDNYIKYDILSDDTNTWLNRIELRSEVNGAIVNPQPQVTFPQASAPTEVWLRLTKSGTNYSGEYSLDGQTWQSIGQPVANAMVDPAFGIFTLGVNSGGGTARFEYFALDGSTGCEEPEPENRAPVIEGVTATPSVGFAPLQVAFDAEATDPDAGTTLTYAWDFNGDGTTDSTAEDPTHTYTAPGEYTAEVTVSDGELDRSRTVTVNVLEPDDAEARFRVLVFSKTAGFRHDSIDEGHAAIEALGEENNFQVDHTEEATAFRDAILNRYDAVVFLSTTGDVLNTTQQRAFERFIQAGGGFTGIHAAADTEYDWNWYGHLVGGYFLSHPPGTPDATVHVEDGEHHSTEGLPTPWQRTDEWYNYRSPDYQDPDVPDGDYSPREGGVHVLLTVDEATYAEGDGSDGVNDDHPISWCQAYDGGRSWYTGMGHTAGTFSEPEFLLHLLGGIETAAGMPGTEGCDPPNRAPTVQAAADPNGGQAPLKVRFSAAGSDPDGDQLTYLWEFGDGQRSFRQNPTHVYQAPGQYSAKVTVTDGNGGSASATVAVNVTNPPGNAAPTVRAAAEPDSGRPSLTVRFSAAGIDPDGDPLAYAWDFGDGDVAYGARATHTYDERGTYTARVTVTDPRGATGSATLTIRITRSGFFAVAGESASRPGVRVPSTFDAARVVNTGLRYRVSCEERCRVTSTLRMRGGDRERLGASSARHIDAGKSRQVVVRLDRRVRRKLLAGMRAAGLSRVRATLVVRVAGANGTAVLWRDVTLRR